MLARLFLFAILIVSTNSVRVFQIPDEQYGPDPEIYMNATQLITSKGYPCENHWVTTEDGYILNLIRIPHGRNNAPIGQAGRRVILLQHGLLTSATNFLTAPTNNSLAFMLADAGADVWLGNSRGNVYSRNHTSLDPKHLEFWQFGWDEMAKYDLPANLNYMTNITGQDQLYYAGHSQGTAMAFAEFSVNQELASRIKHFIALAPVTRVGHAKGPIIKLAPFGKEINSFLDLFGHGALMIPRALRDFIAVEVCREHAALCTNFLFELCGYDTSNFNKSHTDIIVSHNPAGTSSRDILQWAQNVDANQFQKFDYGSAAENIKHYGQPTPPIYDPSKVKVPVALFTGGNDWLADPTDVAWLVPQLTNLTHHVNVDYYNHLDFIWGIDAPQKIYKTIVDIVMS